MIYRVWVHARIKGEVESKIIELGSKADLAGWLVENKQWRTKVQEVDNINKVEEEKIAEVNNDLVLDAEMLKKIVNLLKGNKEGTRSGLSLASFAMVHGVASREIPAQKELKPKYDLLLKKLGDEIEMKNKKWFYKGVNYKK